MSPSPKISSPSRRSAYLSTPAFFRRFVTLLLASVLLLFVAGSALATIDAPRPLVGEPYTSGVWDPSELPDVALLVSGVESADPTMERLVIPALRDLPGVAAVTAELAPSGRIALHVALAPEADENVVAAIRSVVASSLPDAHVALGGRTVADQDLLSRLNRSTVVAVVPVVLLLTALITLAFGGQLGIAAGGTVGLSTLLGGLVGSQIAGKFDGTLATTAVPAVLVAVLVSTVLTLRLLEWFKNPIGEDQAAAIRNSVRHLLPETGLLFGGLVVTALLLELLGTGRATASVVAVGGIIAAIITLGALPALLSTLDRVPTKDEGIFSSELLMVETFPLPSLAALPASFLALASLLSGCQARTCWTSQPCLPEFHLDECPNSSPSSAATQARRFWPDSQQPQVLRRSPTGHRQYRNWRPLAGCKPQLAASLPVSWWLKPIRPSSCRVTRLWPS